MTKHERFLNVLANKPVDRVPVAFFHHFLEDWTDFGKGIEDDEVFEKNIEGHRIARKLFDPDVAKVMNDSLMLMPVEASFVKTAACLLYTSEIPWRTVNSLKALYPCNASAGERHQPNKAAEW